MMDSTEPAERHPTSGLVAVPELAGVLGFSARRAWNAACRGDYGPVSRVSGRLYVWRSAVAEQLLRRAVACERHAARLHELAKEVLDAPGE